MKYKKSAIGVRLIVRVLRVNYLNCQRNSRKFRLVRKDGTSKAGNEMFLHSTMNTWHPQAVTTKSQKNSEIVLISKAEACETQRRKPTQETRHFPDIFKMAALIKRMLCSKNMSIDEWMKFYFKPTNNQWEQIILSKLLKSRLNTQEICAEKFWLNQVKNDTLGFNVYRKLVPMNWKSLSSDLNMSRNVQ